MWDCVVRRVKNIVRELNNEKVDIIRWSEDVQEFVADALKPAQIRSFDVNEEDKVIHVTVDEEDLSKAIGRRGQNARLTSKLVGWDVQVRKDESQHEQFEAKVADAAMGLAEELGVEPLVADKLFRAGGATVDLVEQMPLEYIEMALEGDRAMAEEVLAKAAAKNSGDGTAEAPETPQEAPEGDAPEENEAPQTEEVAAADSEEN